VNAGTVFLALLGAAVLALVVVIALFNVRRAQSRRRAESLPDEARREILALIARAGDAVTNPCVLLRPTREPSSCGASRIGGHPDLAPGVSWPRMTGGDSAPFLAQVRLSGPTVPPPWNGRLIGIFEDVDSVHLTNSVDPVVPATPAVAKEGHTREVLALTPLRLPQTHTRPADEDDWISAYSSANLLRSVPGVREILVRHGCDPERTLPYVLVPGIHTFEIGVHHVCLLGGEPELIQSEHEARCPLCSQPMSLLLQLGDLLGLPGDAPIVYVYGCATHVTEARAFVDMH
jgi:hypothetical protein